MSVKTRYTATGPDGHVYTRSSANRYTFAVIITDLRDSTSGGSRSWAEWASRRDLAERNAAAWNSRRGTQKGHYGQTIHHGAGYSAVVVPVDAVVGSGRARVHDLRAYTAEVYQSSTMPRPALRVRAGSTASNRDVLSPDLLYVWEIRADSLAEARSLARAKQALARGQLVRSGAARSRGVKGGAIRLHRQRVPERRRRVAAAKKQRRGPGGRFA